MQDKINYRQIENAFQETVSRLFAEGYNICTRTMGGSQGEIAKVDLLRDGHRRQYTEVAA